MTIDKINKSDDWQKVITAIRALEAQAKNVADVFEAGTPNSSVAKQFRMSQWSYETVLQIIGEVRNPAEMNVNTKRVFTAPMTIKLLELLGDSVHPSLVEPYKGGKNVTE